MAYVQKDVIEKARAALKVLNKQYGVKATLSGVNSSCMYLTVAAGSIDFIEECCNNKSKLRTHDVDSVVAYIRKNQCISVNQYYLEDAFSGKALEYLQKAKEIMYTDHWDKSDIQSDYFHCAYYVNMHVGRWDKPYQFTSKN